MSELVVLRAVTESAQNDVSWIQQEIDEQNEAALRRAERRSQIHVDRINALDAAPSKSPRVRPTTKDRDEFSKDREDNPIPKYSNNMTSGAEHEARFNQQPDAVVELAADQPVVVPPGARVVVRLVPVMPSLAPLRSPGRETRRRYRDQPALPPQVCAVLDVASRVTNGSVRHLFENERWDLQDVDILGDGESTEQNDISENCGLMYLWKTSEPLFVLIANRSKNHEVRIAAGTTFATAACWRDSSCPQAVVNAMNPVAKPLSRPPIARDPLLSDVYQRFKSSQEAGAPLLEQEALANELFQRLRKSGGVADVDGEVGASLESEGPPDFLDNMPSENFFKQRQTGSAQEISVAHYEENPRGCQPGELDDFNATFAASLDAAVLTEEQRTDLKSLLMKYFDVFRASNHLRPIRGFQARLELKDPDPSKPELKPVWTRPRPFTDDLRRNAGEHFAVLEKNGVIEEAALTSPWQSPLVAAPKKDPTTGLWTLTRWCISYVGVNERLKNWHAQTPIIDDQLRQVGGDTPFKSALDAASAYHQCMLDDASAQFTAFYVPPSDKFRGGRFQYKRLPFGLHMSAAACVKVLSTIFDGLESQGLIQVIDDLLLCSRSWPEHLLLLEEVFTRARRFNLSFRGSKASFCPSSIEFCGVQIDREGAIHKTAAKTDAVAEWPTPVSAKETRTFVGFAGFYRQWVKDFARKAKPLTDCMSNESVFKWGAPQAQAFESLKEALICDVTLHQPDYTREFHLATDWSNTGVGGVLYQLDDNHRERPIAYYSKVLSGADLNLTSSEGELASILANVERFALYLKGRKFILHTDNAALVYLLGADGSPPTPKLQRWCARLIAFDFDIRFRRGADNQPADALSRRPAPRIEELSPAFLRASDDLDDLIRELVEIDERRAADPLGLARRAWLRQRSNSEVEGGSLPPALQPDATDSSQDAADIALLAAARELTVHSNPVIVWSPSGISGFSNAIGFLSELGGSVAVTASIGPFGTFASAATFIEQSKLAPVAVETLILEHGTVDNPREVQRLIDTLKRNSLKVILAVTQVAGSNVNTSTALQLADSIAEACGLSGYRGPSIVVDASAFGDGLPEAYALRLMSSDASLRRKIEAAWKQDTFTMSFPPEWQLDAESAVSRSILNVSTPPSWRPSTAMDTEMLQWTPVDDGTMQYHIDKASCDILSLDGRYTLTPVGIAHRKGLLEHQSFPASFADFDDDCLEQLVRAAVPLRTAAAAVLLVNRILAQHSAEHAIPIEMRNAPARCVFIASTMPVAATRLTSVPDAEQFMKEQRSDKLTSSIFDYLECSEVPASKNKRALLEKIPQEARGLAKIDGEFTIVDGRLHKRSELGDTDISRPPVLVVPQSLTKVVLLQHHDAEVGAHYGRQKTLGRIKALYWWPHMHNVVAKHVASCTACALAKVTERRNTGLQIGMKARGAFEQVHCDTWGPFPPTLGGACKYAITLSCGLTCYSAIAFVQDLERYTVAHAILMTWVTRFGKPKRFIFDRGSEYTSEWVRSMLRLCGCESAYASTYRPSTNSRIERLHRVWRSSVAIFCERIGTQQYWDIGLAFAVFALMQCPIQDTPYSPHELVFGHNFPTPLDEAWSALAEIDIDPAQGADLLKFVGGKRELLAHIRQAVSDASYAAREDSSNRNNIDREAASFKIGDLVGRRLVQQSSAADAFASKFAFAAAGPYRIETLSNALGAQTLGIRHVSDTVTKYYLTAKDVFIWPPDADARPPLDTVLRAAELRLRMSPKPSSSARRAQPRHNEPTADEFETVRYAGNAPPENDPEDEWRDDSSKLSRLRRLVDAANKGARFVLVHRVTGENPAAPSGTRVDVARVVEAVLPGVVGAFVAIHYYQLSEIKKNADGTSTSTPIDMSSSMPRIELDVDSPGCAYEALPRWRSGTDVSAVEHQPKGFAPDEDVLPLAQVIGEPFALLSPSEGMPPRWLPKPVLHEWKTKLVVPRAVRDALLLRSTRTGTRSDPVLWASTLLTYADVDNMTAAQVRAACEERSLPTTATNDAGKTRKVNNPVLKTALREWITEHGQQRDADAIGNQPRTGRHKRQRGVGEGRP